MGSFIPIWIIGGPFHRSVDSLIFVQGPQHDGGHARTSRAARRRVRPGGAIARFYASRIEAIGVNVFGGGCVSSASPRLFHIQ